MVTIFGRFLLLSRTAFPQRTLYWVTQEDRRWIALRRGRWKIIRFRDQPWQLYNLEQDPGESKDLSTQQPAKLQELLSLYDREMAQDNLQTVAE